tara:strand:- start:90 stop:1331 length:1242 start_codon:yes stop_codon:yes gene_type:complete
MEKTNSIPIFSDEELEGVTNDIIATTNSNESSLPEAYKQRFLYKTRGTPLLLPDGFDFLATNSFYGKVDTFGRVVIPKKDSLVLVDEKFSVDQEVYLNKDLYSLYLDFYEKNKVDFGINRFSMRDFLRVFQIAKGADVYGQNEANYKERTAEKIKNIYLDNVASSKFKKDNAGNFVQYMNNVLELIKLGKIAKDVMYSEYLVSGENSMTNSGLLFETRNDVKYDDNSGKFHEYYKFGIYGGIVFRLFLHGLRYDANVPWRFGMDFNLEPTVKKIKGITIQQYFDNNFDLAEGTLKEMVLFFEVLLLSYKDLISEIPYYYREEDKAFSCYEDFGQFKKRRSAIYNREPFSDEQLKELYTDNFRFLLLEYAKVLNSFFKKREDLRGLLLEISNRVQKGLDKESLVRYTFNKMKYC